MLNRREDLEMLTADQIKGREFLVSLRGYDREEVHGFLSEVAKLVGDLQAQVSSLESRQAASPPAVIKAEPAVAPPIAPAVDTTATFFEDLGKTTQRILEAAHEAGSEIQRKARNEADHELAEAHARAAKLVAEGQRRREVIEGVVYMLEERRAALADDLRGVLQAVDQVLADFAPPTQLLLPEEFATAAALTAPDVTWVPEDDPPLAIAAEAGRDSDTGEVDFRGLSHLKRASGGQEVSHETSDDEPDTDEDPPIATPLAKASRGVGLR